MYFCITYGANKMLGSKVKLSDVVKKEHTPNEYTMSISKEKFLN